MSKKGKSKELKDKEDDLLFYLEYWNKFPSTFKKIAQKEIDQLEDESRTTKKTPLPFMGGENITNKIYYYGRL